MSEENQNSQNNNISSDSEDLINTDTVNEEKKNQEDPYYILYGDNYNILEEITFILIINNNKENKIKYEKVIYKGREITYKEFNDLSQEELKTKYELDGYNILFENKEKIIGHLNKNEEIINKLFKNLENKLSIEIKFKEYKNKTDDYNNNINCEYFIIDSSFPEKIKYYQDENILDDDNCKGFTLFLKEIINYISNQATINNNSTKDSTNDSKQIKTDNFMCFTKIVGEHKDITRKIRELDDGSFISDGYNEIFKYNKDLKLIKKEHFKNYYSFFIDKNEVIISLKNKLTSLSKPDTNISLIKAIYPCRNIFRLKDGNYLICSESGIYYASNIFNPISSDNKCRRLSEMVCRGGIKITDDIISITSNRILSKGENKLIFFNSSSQIFLKEIEIRDFSFTLSDNNCSIMRIPKYENSKLLFVACKKYLRCDKNGILLVNLQFNKNCSKIFLKFYDTNNFEVYCFCPILKKENKIILRDVQKIETEYFFVGGFDIDKREGIIKLYKVIFYDEIEKIEIEFIQDIVVEKKKGKNDLECFKGFKGPISCIIQSSQGEILATCYDGNVYLFSEPDLDKMIKELNISNIL